jgi:small conductance mechanosensitive channel
MPFGVLGVVLAQGRIEDLDGAIVSEQLTLADVLAALAALVVSTIVAILIGRATSRFLGRPGGRSEQIAKLAARVVRWVIQLVGVAIALSFLGLSLGWFSVTVALLLGLLFVAGRPLIESLAAGLALAARPAFEVGDDVAIDEFEGKVAEITGRSTVIQLADGRRVHFPNVDVVGKTIVVFTTSPLRRTSLDVDLDASSDLALAERAILEALRGLDAIAEDPPPDVKARSFGDESVRLSVRFWHPSDLASGGAGLDHAVRAIQRAARDGKLVLAADSDEPGTD